MTTMMWAVELSRRTGRIHLNLCGNRRRGVGRPLLWPSEAACQVLEPLRSRPAVAARTDRVGKVDRSRLPAGDRDRGDRSSAVGQRGRSSAVGQRGRSSAVVRRAGLTGEAGPGLTVSSLARHHVRWQRLP